MRALSNEKYTDREKAGALKDFLWQQIYHGKIMSPCLCKEMKLSHNEFLLL